MGLRIRDVLPGALTSLAGPAATQLLNASKSHISQSLIIEPEIAAYLPLIKIVAAPLSCILGVVWILIVSQSSMKLKPRATGALIVFNIARQIVTYFTAMLLTALAGGLIAAIGSSIVNTLLHVLMLFVVDRVLTGPTI